MHLPVLSRIALFTFWLWPAWFAAGGEFNFTWLGDLPNGLGSNGPDGLSADGSVVVGGALTEMGSEAYRWTRETGMLGLGELPGGAFESRANAVSADGLIVVGTDSSANSYPEYQEAFRWTTETGMVGLGDFPGDGFRSYAYGVSPDGSVIVGKGRHGGPGAPTEAARWEGGIMTGLGRLTPYAPVSYAREASLHGSVIVGTGYDSTGYYRAFRWTAETGMVGLGSLPGGWRGSGASGVSADGAVIVGGSHTGKRTWEAFRWTQEDGMVSLGDLPGGDVASGASGVSADGLIIVGRSDVGDYVPDAPFIWDEHHEMRDVRELFDEWGIDLGEWSLLNEVVISANGMTLAGYAWTADFDKQSWVLTLPVRLDQVMGDYDGDACVDLTDYAAWGACMTGPDADSHPKACEPFDFNFDGDVDLKDMARFQSAFDGK